MRKFLLKIYPIYIYCLVGIPVFTITFLCLKEEAKEVFWFLMFIGALFVGLQQLQWMRISKK